MIISIIKAIVLGVVEGVTEFLPISSTGHLIIVNQWINFTEPFTKMFDVVIQLGAILAVVVYFWNKLWPFGKGEMHLKNTFSIWFKTIVGVVPALIIGALLANFVEEKLFNPWVVAVMLVVGGIILLFIDKKGNNSKINSVSEISFLTAFFVGLIQCLSLIPGTSRAAATIIGGLLLGASRSAAVEFSFFLAIPTMIAASGYSVMKHGLSISGSELVVLIVGFIVAFAVALVVIRFFMNYIKNNSFKNFGWYRIVLGVIVLIYFIF